MAGEGKAAAAKKDPRAWSALTPPLADFILEAVSAMGFAKPTPVQAHVIPLFNGNKDVVVEVCNAVAAGPSPCATLSSLRTETELYNRL